MGSEMCIRDSNKIARSFSLIEDEYLRERGQDILDVGKKILKNLLGYEREQLAHLDSPVIVVAHNLTPADTIAMRREKVIGFATDIGGRTSHTAIMARSLEIPAVVGLKNVVQMVKPNDTIIIDGNQGIVVISPDEMTLESYKREQQKYKKAVKKLEGLRDLPAVTLDGHEITLLANIEVPDEIPSVLAHGASGVGLYRTEYLFLDRKDLPSEEEQYKHYQKVAEKMLPNTVILRTLDLGADKISHDLNILPERNPFMGMRAIRFCLRYKNVFKSQLKAILRASPIGNLKIMYPMISGVDEFHRANDVLKEARKELDDQNIPYDPNIEVGILVEVPSAAITSDVLAREADFLSIGTNDLIQYTLAVDRVNENVAHLYEPLHLAILRLIKSIIDYGHRYGKKVSMCGEMAADSRFTKILLGMGLDELSMSPIAIPKIKQIIRSANYQDCLDLSLQILNLSEYKRAVQGIKKSKVE